jgi:glycosyltransferase involved in cell wall biosynthesis
MPDNNTPSNPCFQRLDTRNQPMKPTFTPTLLFIVENNPVPPDIRVWREAKTAIQAGYSVIIISPTHEHFSKSYEVIDDIQIYRHPFVKGKGGQFHQLLEYANALFWELLISLRVFFRHRFHVIHGANPPDHIFLIALFFKLFGVKFVFDHHDLAPELYTCKFSGRKTLIYRLLRLMEKLSCHSADVIISTNASYKQHIVDKDNVSPDKIYIVRNDPELPERPVTSTPTRNQNAFVSQLLYIGSINTQDGVDILVRALYTLVKEYSHKTFHCAVVGDGGSLLQTKQLCTQLGMDEYIDFTGYIYDRDTLKEFIDNADICLETAPDSEVNRKSTFIKVMEYMAAGKPIVAFDLEETRFTVKDTALLVEPGDIHAYAQAIYRLIKEPLTRKTLGDKAQRRIIEELNWGTASRQLLLAYEKLNHR